MANDEADEIVRTAIAYTLRRGLHLGIPDRREIAELVAAGELPPLMKLHDALGNPHGSLNGVDQLIDRLTLHFTPAVTVENSTARVDASIFTFVQRSHGPPAIAPRERRAAAPAERTSTRSVSKAARHKHEKPSIEHPGRGRRPSSSPIYRFADRPDMNRETILAAGFQAMVDRGLDKGWLKVSDIRHISRKLLPSAPIISEFFNDERGRHGFLIFQSELAKLGGPDMWKEFKEKAAHIPGPFRVITQKVPMNRGPRTETPEEMMDYLVEMALRRLPDTSPLTVLEIEAEPRDKLPSYPTLVKHLSDPGTRNAKEKIDKAVAAAFEEATANSLSDEPNPPGQSDRSIGSDVSFLI